LGASLQGGLIEIHGQRQTARWLWSPAGPGQAQGELWLPLELLQGQLGMTSRSRPDGSLKLDWFGISAELPAGSQRSLEDEVALPVGRLLQTAGARLTPQGNLLRIEMAQVPLMAVRSRELGTARRVVLDLGAAALLYRGERQLVLGVSSSSDQRQTLETLGFQAQQGPDGLRLTPPSAARPHLLTLGGPARLVLDFGAGSDAANPSANPRAEASRGGKADGNTVDAVDFLRLRAHEFLCSAIAKSWVETHRQAYPSQSQSARKKWPEEMQRNQAREMLKGGDISPPGAPASRRLRSASCRTRIFANEHAMAPRSLPFEQG
jgi:hypothetical protein